VKAVVPASPAMATSEASMRNSACLFRSIAKLQSIAVSFTWGDYRRDWRDGDKDRKTILTFADRTLALAV
jgi:hypothetical protein